MIATACATYNKNLPEPEDYSDNERSVTFAELECFIVTLTE
jgi:hypothetical protein